MKTLLTVLLIAITTVVSSAQTQPDLVDFIQLDPQSCCYEVNLQNTHIPESKLKYLRLRILTPGVRFQPGAGGPWPTTVETDTLVVFGDGIIELDPRQELRGYNVCFEFDPGQARSFRLEWQTALTAPVTTEIVTLDCNIQQKACDSVDVASVTVPGQPDGSCAYEFGLYNVHDPAGELNGFRLILQTPGAEFVGSATGPWDVREQTVNSVMFGTDIDPLGPGIDLQEFRVFIRPPQGNPGNVVVRWVTSYNGQIMCEEDIMMQCTPIFQPRGDTLLLKKLQDCSYDVGIINKHTPKSTLNGLRLSILTQGARFSSVSAASGWRIASQTSLNVQFSPTTGTLASGDSIKGFLASFAPSSSGLVRFSWTTTSAGVVKTTDTMSVQCTPPPPVVCDSLVVVGLPTECGFDFGFVNQHEPASAVNEFHINLQTGGATISDAVAPANWTILSRTATSIVFKDTVGTVAAGAGQSGFLLTLTRGGVGNSIVFEYCTALDGAVNCCEFSSVECAPMQQRCDSLAYAPTPDYCSYAFSLTNLAVPATDIDAWRMRLDDANAILWAAEAPAGWTLDTLDDQHLRFVKTGGALAPGETAEGFLLSFVPSGSSGIIPFTWSTERNGQDRCSDTASVACEVKIVQCDVIDVTTSTERPCCFDFTVENTHLPRGTINGFNVQILTPGVTLFTSTINDPENWTHISNSTRVGWRRTDGAILPGETLEGFSVCYDNSAINNADFQVVTQTVENGLIICEDTLTIKCDRTLSIELLPGSRPGSFRLHQNFPNPFNPTTTIMFDLPRRSDVTLSLYDTRGKLVMDLGSGEYEAGSWQITLDATTLPSGTYHYQLRTEGFSETRTLILLK